MDMGRVHAWVGLVWVGLGHKIIRLGWSGWVGSNVKNI